MIERRQIEVPGARLVAESQGAGSDIVLVHGIDSDRHAWDWSWTVFAQRRRVTRYDLREFGESVALQRGAFRHSHDLKAALDALGIQRCDLAGVSMGGGISLNFALDFPDRVRRLALISPGMVAWEWSDEWRSAWRPIVEAAQAGDMARAREIWWNHPIFAMTRLVPAAAKKLRETIESCSGKHWLGDDEEPRLPDVDRLTSLSVPTLLLTGSEDLPDFRLIGALIEAAAPNVRRIDYKGAGHLLHLERPQAFLADMLEFFAD